MKDNDFLLESYELMLSTRYMERRERILTKQGHAYIHASGEGHEALTVLGQLMAPEDYFVPYWRDKAMVFARTRDINALAHEFFGTEKSSSMGRNIPGHSSSPEHKVFSTVTSAGGNCLPACGIAWGCQLRQHGVVVVSIGDASTRQGEFLEAWSFAKEKSLPIIFVVHDNEYGISSCTREVSALALGMLDGAKVIDVDGSNFCDVLEQGREAFTLAREHSEPSILWCKVNRLQPHTSSDDHSRYRSQQELEGMADPLEVAQSYLLREKVLSEAALESMQRRVQAQVDGIYDGLKSATPPAAESAFSHLYGPSLLPTPLPLELNEPCHMVDAVNKVLHAGFKHFPNLLGFGEDIADPKGGVFGFTKGLSSAFPDRVSNSPLAEATIVGTGVGLAATGWRPVFEIQFIDFITPAFEQIVSQLTTLRWRSAGGWAAPMVIYAPYGAYLPGGGMSHSQSNEGLWCHIPGWRVAIPSNSADLANVFWQAFQDSDPTLILIPKHIMRVKHDYQPSAPFALGSGRIHKSGQDATVVAWGNTLELALDVIKEYEKNGCEIELIDPVTLEPFDWALLKASVIKTGRLIVVQEDIRNCSVGTTIISEITRDKETFFSLLAPPQLCARESIPIGYHPNLEYGVLPSKADIIAALDLVLGDL